MSNIKCLHCGKPTSECKNNACIKDQILTDEMIEKFAANSSEDINWQRNFYAGAWYARDIYEQQREKDLAEIEKRDKKTGELLGVGNPYPLSDVLQRLVDAAEYLLHNKSYDGHDYEEISICKGRAKDIIKALQQKTQ